MLNKISDTVGMQYRALSRWIELFDVRYRVQCSTVAAWATIFIMVLGSASVGYYIAYFQMTEKITAINKMHELEMAHKLKAFGAIDKLKEAAINVDNATENTLNAAERIDSVKQRQEK